MYVLGISETSVLQAFQSLLDQFPDFLRVGDASKYRGLQVASRTLIARRATPSRGFHPQIGNVQCALDWALVLGAS